MEELARGRPAQDQRRATVDPSQQLLPFVTEDRCGSF
jgi:hypothetical protein